MLDEYPCGTYYSEKEKRFFIFEKNSSGLYRYSFYSSKKFVFNDEVYLTALYETIVDHLRFNNYTLVNQEIDEELLWE